ncbi:MAG TPA: peptidylprolyl isomerase [Candidatus Tenderia electrophaga]|uniref:Peptidyl-prolyl cis-trans isomerase n=1 Tax=Candidatus Tenderia electrophaga TaxID=1748243 RepID=A0A832J2V4_9GAMM|nr:peptidylprolyl isomerase [Candidatus Tenderia electrophaga]
MQIEKDKVVTVHYRVSSLLGEVIEDSHDDEPLVYLHGYQAMVQALEDEMLGKAAGDKVSLTVENAYGEREEGLQQRVSINHIVREGKSKPKLKPGMMVYLNTKQGSRPVTVVKAGLKFVDVDTNHPYAGKPLTFDVEVLKVRDATADEISHGHVHGEGGVHH